MTRDHDPADGATLAANDNGDSATAARIDKAVLHIAKLLGRQIAREQFRASANDNQPEPK